MSEIRIAKRYAKSVMDLAVEHNALERVNEDMRLIENTCKENRQLVVSLSNPVIHASKKNSILNAIFGGKISDITQKLLTLLCNKHRVQFLYEISTEFRNAYNEHMGIEVAQVATPFELDGMLRSQFTEIVKSISGKSKVELIEKVDESLIGGYVLTVKDRQIDDSIRARLRKMRTKLVFA
jgi:F-type H+-transporting ATPase subunit delta